MWDDHGNLHHVKANAPFEFGVAQLPAKRRPGSADRAAAIFYSSRRRVRSSAPSRWNSPSFMTTPERAAEGDQDAAMSRSAPMPGDAEMKAYVARLSRRGGGA